MSSEHVERVQRWTIPTCPKCGGLVVNEGGYDGEYTVCSNYDCDEFDRFSYPHPDPVPIEVVPASALAEVQKERDGWRDKQSSALDTLNLLGAEADALLGRAKSAEKQRDEAISRSSDNFRKRVTFEKQLAELHQQVEGVAVELERRATQAAKCRDECRGQENREGRNIYEAHAATFRGCANLLRESLPVLEQQRVGDVACERCGIPRGEFDLEFGFGPRCREGKPHLWPRQPDQTSGPREDEGDEGFSPDDSPDGDAKRGEASPGIGVAALAPGRATESTSPDAGIQRGAKARGQADPPTCDGYGQLVHPPSEADVRAGESRRLHTPCPDCPRCQPDQQVGAGLSDEDRERLHAIADRLSAAAQRREISPATEWAEKDVELLRNLASTQPDLVEEAGQETILHYDGSFPLGFLRDGEYVRAGNEPGAGLDGSCVVEAPDYSVRVEPGDELVRGNDGELFVRSPTSTQPVSPDPAGEAGE